MKHKLKLIDILIGVVFTIFFIGFGLLLSINLKPIYYTFAKQYDLSSVSGMSEEVIRENYDALIDYCSPFYHGELKFPSLPASSEGIIHFAEVKEIFNAFFIAMVVSFLVILVIVYSKYRKKDFNYLITSSITMIVLPTIVSIACLINFDKAFVIFHKIFFRNDYWYFDPVTDPIILILPQQFFLLCAVVIICTVIIGSLLLFLCYRVLKKRKMYLKR